ncbi:hypothetical protein D1Z97_03750 [Riemerella anatipestifer]|nr:hypothetical protein [Riemerella anatipestifer]
MDISFEKNVFFVLPIIQLEYSIESRTENNRDYQVLGIGYTFEHKFNVIQWLYIDIETQKIYEYDIANDKLAEFK